VGQAETHGFQAETKQLLNIVANALYTDKHVFVRELVSNASDALEKLRHRQVAGDEIVDPASQLRISITTNEEENTISIADSGIGMDRQELIDNLGTIARSGSKAFIQKLRDEGKGGDTGANIIGQFGVGFYSSFMVAEHVTVYSQSAKPGSPAFKWTSKGDGSYELVQLADGQTVISRGSKIVMKLRDTCRDFSKAATIKDVLTRYSNYVSFPILLNEKQVNTIQAIWASSKSDVTESMYTEFYKFKSGDFEAPLFKLHFSADAPTSIKALLFVGQSHDEKYGMGRIKPGVDLYSRKVLIQAGSTNILPDWLRFLHGVVDSEDIPLNISRESMQDSALMRRIKAVLTRRAIRFLDSEARRDAVVYNTKFFPEFGNFLKEGCITDTAYSQDLAKLLRFESSALPAGQFTSLDEYIARMPVGQQSIYYLVAPHRGLAEASPYMEAFRGGNKVSSEGAGAEGVESSSSQSVEVIFLYSPIDDFVMNNLREYNSRKLVTAETAELDPELLQGVKKQQTDKDSKKAEDDKSAASKDATSPSSSSSSAAQKLTETEMTELGKWMVKVLPNRISKVRSTTRLRTSPCVVTDHESASLRRMMRMVEAGSGGSSSQGGSTAGTGGPGGGDSQGLRLEQHMLPKQVLEVNPAHPVIVKLFAMKETDPGLAVVVAEQLLDNSLIAAGLIDDSRTMLPRLSSLLERVVGVVSDSSSSSTYTTSAAIESKRASTEREDSDRKVVEFGEKLQ
jgi:HSP90 family molecular chaperone